MGHLIGTTVPAATHPLTAALRKALLVAGEFTPPGPSPVMSQQPDHLPKLAPVVS